MNVIFRDERHTPTSSRPHAITTGPTHAMAKTLDTATSHTLRRGHVLGAEFAAVARCRVIVPFLRHSHVAHVASMGPFGTRTLWSERTEDECDISG